MRRAPQHRHSKEEIQVESKKAPRPTGRSGSPKNPGPGTIRPRRVRNPGLAPRIRDIRGCESSAKVERGRSQLMRTLRKGSRISRSCGGWLLFSRESGGVDKDTEKNDGNAPPSPTTRSKPSCARPPSERDLRANRQKTYFWCVVWLDESQIQLGSIGGTRILRPSRSNVDEKSCTERASRLWICRGGQDKKSSVTCHKVI